MNRKKNVPLMTLTATALFFLISISSFVEATVYTVNSNANSGAGALRDQIAAASSGDTINFNLTYPATITLSSELLIDKNLTIAGPGANNLTISGADVTRIFNITAGTVTISDITAAHGRLTAAAAHGAAFRVNSGAALTINRGYIHSNQVNTTSGGCAEGGGAYVESGTLAIYNSTLSNNHACTGGALSSRGTSATTITNCTISGNHNYGNVSGASVYSNDNNAISPGSMTVLNSTITGNTGDYDVSGLSSYSGTQLSLKNTITAGNNSTISIDSDFYANPSTFTSGGYNLIGNEGSTNYTWTTGDVVGEYAAKQNAGLNSTLSDNGGYTPTHALNAGSQAIDPGDSNGAPFVDQRGYLRSGNSDKGAYEYNGTLPVAIAAVGVFPTDFLARWNAVPGASGYKFDVATDPGFTSFLPGYQDLNYTGTSKSVTGLTPGATYYYRVRAYNGNFLSQNSNTITVCAFPTVSNVASSTANGTYKAGDTIAVTITFTMGVNVTETPTLLLETGSTNRTAAYISGSGTPDLTFNYIVQPGDSTADLDYVATNALSLSGGTIKSVGGLDAGLTLPAPGGAGSLGANNAIVIDALAPTVSSVSVPTNGPYAAGQNLDFTVNYSEAVTVVTTGGTPYLPVTLDTGGTVQAAYVSGTGTTALAFRYTVVTGNRDTNGIALAGSITANGGTLRDAAGNDASLTLNNVGSTAGVLVGPVTTTTMGSSLNPSVYGDAVTFTATVMPTDATGSVTFKRNGTDIPDCGNLGLSPSGSAMCSISSLLPGSHSVTALYSGDSNFEASTSSPLSQLVVVALKFTGETGTGHPSIQDAYDNAVDGDTILILGMPLSENLLLNRENISVLLQGGCNTNFQPVTGIFTTVESLEIRNGAAEVEGIILE